MATLGPQLTPRWEERLVQLLDNVEKDTSDVNLLLFKVTIP